ncbi:hypothetical protein [uncultured Prevotella sp.]|uniref:hypothetical protein n=1 Tax=uncultured Prevotella sp. TaxID=159272 RepID=UPI0026177186|nr:hypothetical protein [uncultured Prevotella sp.]
MKKKEYIKPETNILQSEPQAILAGSNGNSINVASKELYTEEEVMKLWERPEQKTIWSD